MPDRVKPSFVIFDIRALWRWASECPDVKNYKWLHRTLYSCTHMATVGVKGLRTAEVLSSTCCGWSASKHVVLWRACWWRHYKQLCHVSKLVCQKTPVTVYKCHTCSSLSWLCSCRLGLVGCMSNGEIFAISYVGRSQHVAARVDQWLYIVNWSVAAWNNNERSRRSNTFSENQICCNTTAV